MIHWLLQPASECPEIAHGAAPEGLLGAAELERLTQLATVKRRGEWLLGRCAAKRLVQRYVEMETGQRPPLDALVIARDAEDVAAPVVVFDSQATPMDLPAGARWVSGAPLVAEPGRRLGYPVPRVSGMRLPISLSISHSHEMALCALYAVGGRWRQAVAQHPGRRSLEWSGDKSQVAGGKRQVTGAQWQDHAVSTGFPAGGLVQVGVDIEGIEPRTDSFVQAYFAADEVHWIGQALDDQQALLGTITWSAKEAVLKALQLGLTVDTRRVSCLPAAGMELTANPEHGWNEVYVQCDPALLPEALRRAGRLPQENNLDWQIRGWWRRTDHFVLTLAALYVEADKSTST
jgi:4'-phosphopantetheinyl transferase EntD